MADIPLTGEWRGPVFWHIAKFRSLLEAEQAAGANEVAVAAHGAAWVFGISRSPARVGAGNVVASVGPMQLPQAGHYAMQLFSANFPPGLASRVHTHPGPEAFYVVGGEQCLESTVGAQRTTAGHSHVIEAGPAMRVIATGRSPRLAFAVVLHPEGHTATHAVADPQPLATCR